MWQPALALLPNAPGQGCSGAHHVQVSSAVEATFSTQAAALRTLQVSWLQLTGNSAAIQAEDMGIDQPPA